MRGLLTPALWSCCISITILFSIWARCCHASSSEPDSHSFQMKMIYKYSAEFQEHVKAIPGMEHLKSEWPRHNTADFHRELAHHDRHRHASRNLLTTDVYSLLPSNITLYSRALGGLHYTFIALGTPSQVFFVALDTGSDLLWVPCDCKQCSEADWSNYGISIPGFDFAIYSPANSTTSKAVNCSDAVCTRTLGLNVCNANAPQACAYSAHYLSANTSSSGTLVQDVVYLASETSGKEFTSQIYLGCAQLQTGDFLDGGAPNGLFGLGPEVYSVPSTFARTGIIKNVFSMCFESENASGTLVFGRKAGASLPSTPIIRDNPSLYYVLGIEGFVAAGEKINVTFQSVFDTGTSYTIFPSNIVKPIGDSMSAAISLKPFSLDVDIASFDYCWNTTSITGLESNAPLSFVFGGGKVWMINGPFVRVVDPQSGEVLFSCLGILSMNDTSFTPIIGFNFMRDYEFFFDQETAAFSWSPSDCSGTNGTSALAPSISPEPALTVPAPAPESAPSSSRPPPPPPPFNTQAPPPQGFPLNKASSISFQPMPIVLLICSTFFFLLSK